MVKFAIFFSYEEIIQGKILSEEGIDLREK
jgi:hypothetical protein